jgi:hypothetical protein
MTATVYTRKGQVLYTPPSITRTPDELLALVRAQICTVCHTRYSAETRWGCPCFAQPEPTDAEIRAEHLDDQADLYGPEED